MSETNVMQLCRICLNNSSFSSNIYVGQSSDENPIYEVINYVYDLGICIDDGLPDYVCRECLRKIKEFEDYKRNAHTAKRKLILLIEKKNVYIKVEEQDYMEGTDAEVTADKEIHEPQIEIYEGERNSVKKEDCEVKDVFSMSEIKKREMDQSNNTESPQTSSWFKDANYRGINYIEFHENERTCNDNEPDIKQEPEEGENWPVEVRECNVNMKRVSRDWSSKKMEYDEAENDMGTEEEGMKIYEGETESGITIESLDVEFMSCHFCGEKRKTMSEFKEHYFSEHMPICVIVESEDVNSECKKKRHRCTFCQKLFSNENDIRKHLEIHIEEKPFKCNMCGYRASDRTHLKGHFRRHTGEKPFKCNLCGYTSSDRSHLNSHILRHTGEKALKCEYCDYRTSDRSRLNTHLRSHTGEKPFKCKVCKFTTSYASALSSHMFKHTGEKPLKCKHCDYRTSVKSNLKIHLRKHTGEKPFKCHICEYATSYSSALSAHILRHRRETL